MKTNRIFRTLTMSILILLSVITMIGLVNAGAIVESSGTDSGDATVSPASPVSQSSDEQASIPENNGGSSPPGAYVEYGEVSIPENGGEVIVDEPVAVDEPVIVGGGNTGNNIGGSTDGGYSIAIPDNTNEGSEAIVTIPGSTTEEDILIEAPVENVPITRDTSVEVLPPEVWIPEEPPGAILPPETPPEVGTCEYPGHPPCTPIPDVWIMPQWTDWFSWRFV